MPPFVYRAKEGRMDKPGNSAGPAWSFTRNRMLRSCPRRYYYHYHLAPAGSRPGAPPRARQAYVLKHITSLDLVLGIAVHQAARELVTAVCDGRTLPPLDRSWQAVRSALNRAYLSSVRDRAAFFQAPRRTTMLHEVYYGGGLARTAIERTRERAACCLESLHRAPLWSVLRDCHRGNVRAIDAPARFQVRETVAWAAPDLVYRTRGGIHVVVDWKTGKKDPVTEQEQVSVYGLFLQITGPVKDPTALEAAVIHLQAEEGTSYPLTSRQLADAEATILSGAREMHRYQDVVERLGEGAASEFPLTARRAQCPRCNFFGLCAAELRGESGAPFALVAGPTGAPPASEPNPTVTSHGGRHASLQ